MIIIGLTGQIASGKGVIAEKLQNKGYLVVTLSQFLKAEAVSQGIPLEREVLQNLGDELRSQFGGGILVRMAIEFAKAEEVELLVIDGLRSVGEVKELKNFGGELIGVEADYERRLVWYLNRDRESDLLTEENFRRVSERENLGTGDFQMNISRCIEMADFVVRNEGNVEGLKLKTEEILGEIGEGDLMRKRRL